MLSILERLDKIRYNDYERLSSSLEIVLVWWKNLYDQKKITVKYLSPQNLLYRLILDTIRHMRWPRKGHMQWSKQMQGIRLQIEIMVDEAGRLFDYGQTATTKLCAMQKQHKTAKKLAAANEDSIPNETSMFETKSEGFVDPKKHLSRKVSPARNTWCSM